MQRSIGVNGCTGVTWAAGMERPAAGRRLATIAVLAAVALGVFGLARLAMHPARGRVLAAGTPWTPHIQRVDEALAQRKIGVAEQAWHAAYLTGLAGRRWEGMLAVGDAARRIGEASGSPAKGEAVARANYMAALFQAREQRSLDGVLGAAEAFAELGDREVADRCLTIAERLAADGRDPQVGARVHLLRERLTARRSTGKGSPRSHSE